jgi:DNA replicative helicase MCM subunit Mcm2 (Cdc46/Mcm family)
MPEDVPTGEVPRHVQVVAEQALVGTAVPGTRVIITGILSIVGGVCDFVFNFLLIFFVFAHIVNSLCT